MKEILAKLEYLRQNTDEEEFLHMMAFILRYHQATPESIKSAVYSWDYYKDLYPDDSPTV